MVTLCQMKAFSDSVLLVEPVVPCYADPKDKTSPGTSVGMQMYNLMVFLRGSESASRCV